jgi:cytochrome c oxidase cbb3-type subunit II
VALEGRLGKEDSVMRGLDTGHVLGTGEWVPRFRVTAALVCAKGYDGRLTHCYRGTLLDWLNDEQREHFLRMGLVEEITEADLAQSGSLPSRQPQGVGGAGVLDVNPEVVEECVASLDRLGVAPDAGAPTARTALREGGERYGNDVIAAAVRSRKLQCLRRDSDSTVPDTAL